MPLADTLLPEFDQEMKTTRSLLERVPLDKASWKPHGRSTTMGALASHITSLAGFGSMIVKQTELDVASAQGQPRQTPQYHTTEELLAAFDANVNASRAEIAKAADPDLTTPWTLRAGPQTIFTMPRAAVLRTMLMNHVIHHRGQLSVYLRLKDVPLPSIYGPTADT